jgi:lysophospholipase L1-like esterase
VKAKAHTGELVVKRGWRTAFIVLLALNLGLVLLGGVAYWQQRHRTKNGAPDFLALPQVSLPGNGMYLAIGDSYSAGEGLGPFLAGTQDLDQGGDRCHQSPLAYPRLLDVPGHPLEFRACSGALIRNVFDVIQEHSGTPDSQGLQIGPTQLHAGQLNDASLITLSISGNDMKFANVLTFCATHAHCMDDRYQGCPTLDTCVEAQLEKVVADLGSLFIHLRDVAGAQSRILVIGYPALFPEALPPVWSLQYKDCQLLHLWDTSERSAIRDFGLELDNNIREQAKASGLEYLDSFRYFSGHEACTSSPWMNYVNAAGGRDVQDGSFHPNAAGQAMFARMIACHLEFNSTVQEANIQQDQDQVDACVAKGAVKD